VFVYLIDDMFHTFIYFVICFLTYRYAYVSVIKLVRAAVCEGRGESAF
jgi:hypothetical protein